MRYDKAYEIIEDIRYKPNHQLRADQVDNSVLRIYWQFDRPDCDNPSRWGVGRSGPVYVFLPDVHTEEQLVRIIFGMTARLEEHECREFFQYGSQKPFDPHKELLDD